MPTVILSAYPDDPMPMPSDHLLELIYEYASLKTQNSHSLHYTLHPSTLLATAMLVNDYIKELLTPMVRAHVRKCLDEEEALYGPLEDSELGEDPEYEATVNAEMGFVDSGVEDNIGGVQEEEDAADVDSDFEGRDNPLNDRMAVMADLFEKQLQIGDLADETVDKAALQTAMEASGILTRRQREALSTVRKTVVDEEGNEQVILERRSTRLYQLSNPRSVVEQPDSEELVKKAKEKTERILERQYERFRKKDQIHVSGRLDVPKTVEARRSSRLNPGPEVVDLEADEPKTEEPSESSDSEEVRVDIMTPPPQPVKKKPRNPERDRKYYFLKRQKIKAQQEAQGEGSETQEGSQKREFRTIAERRPNRQAKHMAAENMVKAQTTGQKHDDAYRSESRRVHHRTRAEREEELATNLSKNPKGTLAKYKAYWGRSARTTPPPEAKPVQPKKPPEQVQKPPPPAPFKRKPPKERHPIPLSEAKIRANEKAQAKAAQKQAEQDAIRRAQRRERRRQRELAAAAAAAQANAENLPLTEQFPELQQSHAEFEPLAGIQTFPSPFDPYGFHDPLTMDSYIPPPLGGPVSGFDLPADDDFGANDDPFAPLPSSFPLAPPDRKRPKYDD